MGTTTDQMRVWANAQQRRVTIREAGTGEQVRTETANGAVQHGEHATAKPRQMRRQPEHS